QSIEREVRHVESETCNQSSIMGVDNRDVYLVPERRSPRFGDLVNSAADRVTRFSPIAQIGSYFIAVAHQYLGGRVARRRRIKNRDVVVVRARHDCAGAWPGGV